MERQLQFRNALWPHRPQFKLGFIGIAIVLCAAGCASRQRERIAVIPQTEGTELWEPAHSGAEAAAEKTGALIYWNAPSREDDVEAQIALVDRVVDGGYQGLVLAPDQALSLISPVRRALAHGIPTVIIGSPLPIPAGSNLSYILNDDREGGRIAAERVAALLKEHGTVALLGINPDITGIMIRTHSFEEVLARNHPGIRIVEKRMGTFNVAHEQQVAEDTLRDNPGLNAIVALMPPTVDGTLTALEGTPEKDSVKVVAFDSADAVGYPSFDRMPGLDCVVQQNTRSMGQQAVNLIHSRVHGLPVPNTVHVLPVLVTRDNINSPEIRQMLSMDFTLGRWRWSSAQ